MRWIIGMDSIISFSLGHEITIWNSPLLQDYKYKPIGHKTYKLGYQKNEKKNFNLKNILKTVQVRWTGQKISREIFLMVHFVVVFSENADTIHSYLF